ncbi:MAG: tRNA (guanosine(37)-N1)-methyltransferase TrmD [bacterium]
MRIDILTLFPNMLEGFLCESILKRAREKKLVTIRLHNIRDGAHDRHKTADDKPYGGGPGMVMKVEPIYRTLKKAGIKLKNTPSKGTLLNIDKKTTRIIMLSPKGKTFTQEKAKLLAKYKRLVLVCGHYEGIDERVTKYLTTDTISIGDYVLTGGELPAAVIVDAVSRMIKGVVGKEESIPEETFYGKIFDWPHYTRPQEFKSMKVPRMLLSGNHGKIAAWRKKQAIQDTKKTRPDLVSDEDL